VRGDFDQLRKVLLLEGEPRYVPKAELWIDRKIMSDYLKRDVKDAIVDTENVVEFWYRAGYDYAHIVPSYTLHERAEWVNEHTGAVTSWNEFKTFPWPTIDEVDFTPVENAVRFLPKKMKIISGTLSGVFEESWMLMGFETFALKLIEDYSLVKAVVDRVGTLMYEIIDKVTQIDGVGAIWHSDDIAYKTSTLLSPEHYRKLIFPWYRRFGNLVHARELPFMYHSDGCLWDVMDDLVDCGYNSIHPVEPLSMDIFELKKRYGDTLCIIGNIEVDSFLTRGTPQMIEREVKRKIEGLSTGGGYCCGSSNTIPEWVPYENFVAMIDAIEKYGNY
jgi:uroporphyrinogen decarboxylase